MSPWFLWLYRLYCASAMGALAGMFNEGATPRPDLFNLAWVALYSASLPYFLLDLKRGVSGRAWLVYGLAAYVSLSPLWSELPLQSLKFTTAMALNLIFAVSVAQRMTFEEIEKQTAIVIVVLLVASLVMIGFGIEKALYRDALQRLNIFGGPMAQGIFSHKNFLGVYAALGLVLSFQSLRGPLRWGAVALCLWGVMASGAATGIAALLAGLLALGVIHASRDQRRYLVAIGPALAALVMFVMLVVSFQAEILAAFGRDDTLTGRTDLWAWAVWFFEQRPIAGWGYGGIFAESGPGPSDILFDGGYAAPHFHSGYLQVLAETGIIGFGSIMAITIGALVSLLRGNRRGLFAGVVLLLAVMPAINLLMRFNDLATILIVAAFVGGEEKVAVTRSEVLGRA